MDDFTLEFPPHLGGQSQAKAGAVNGDQRIRGFGKHILSHLLHPPLQMPVFGQNLQQAKHRQFVHVKQAGQPLGHHQWPAHPVKLNIFRGFSLQPAHQGRPEPIPRGLPRHQI